MSLLLLIFCFAMPALVAANAPDNQKFDYRIALKQSQDAIGGVIGDYNFTDRNGKPVSLKKFHGKPLVISLVYTACYHTCPMTTRHLAKAVRTTRDALGANSFAVATIGFNVAQDTPETMRHFAASQSVDMDNWYFLSADAETIAGLVKDLGFIFFPSPKGFDHVVQASVIDTQGGNKVYRQVYGEVFSIPLLAEPLKQLILGQPEPNEPFLAGLFKKVRFFCTTYDPGSDAYRFDYSLFVGLVIGASIIFLVSFFLAREYWRRPGKGVK
ncbi:MAG: SCO family protein [Gammaproteobacteria bacterium]|nr:SCO family protein [Gammaproteobacteria bacterium]